MLAQNGIELDYGVQRPIRMNRLLKRYRGCTVLLICSQGVAHSDTLFYIKASMKRGDNQYFEMTCPQADTLHEHLRSTVDLCRRENVGLIIVVGDSRAQQMARIVAAGIPYAGDVSDLLQGAAIKQALPSAYVGAVPGLAKEALGAENGVGNTTGQGVGSPLSTNLEAVNPRAWLTLPASWGPRAAWARIMRLWERYLSSQPSPTQLN